MRNVLKISIILWIPTIIAFAALGFKLMTLNQVLAIYIVVAIIQMILVFYAMYRLINVMKSKGITPSNIMNAKTIIPKGKCNDMFIKANTGILPKFVIPTNPHHNSVFRVKFVVFTDEKLQEQLKFSIMRTCQSNSCEQEINDIKPTKEGTYMFDISVNPREKLNFKFDKDVTLQSFTVDELYAP